MAPEARGAPERPAGPGSGYAPIGGAAGASGTRRRLKAGAAAAALTLLLGLVAAAAWLRAGGRGRLRASLPLLEQEWIKWPEPFDSKKEECGLIEDGVDYQGTDSVNLTSIVALPNVGSAEMCCSACAGFPNCSVWTWGKKRDTKFLTDTCFLKHADTHGSPRKVKNSGVVSGFPSSRVQKYGVIPAPPSQSSLMDGIAAGSVIAGAKGTKKCPGVIAVGGHGPVELINAGVNVPHMPGGKVEVPSTDLVVPHMGGRTYFGEVCTEGDYHRSFYAAINLLGKTLRYTTDVSGTGCGCNAALYLVSMRQNDRIGKCNDYYCDAMSVCGVACGEIDIQEANQYAWFSTLHTFTNHSGADSLGVARGYGGSLGEPPRRDFTSKEYGPGGLCVDTQLPFQVAVSFPTDASGQLEAMEVVLSQEGKTCPLFLRTDEYRLKGGRNGLAELTEALRKGMTPVISYWSSRDMLWMDGIGTDGRGPCVMDDPKACPKHVRFLGFSIEPIASSATA